MGKKRSGYRGRRRSQSLGALPVYEVCKTIDKSLSPAERLQLLNQYSLENASSKSTQEIIEDEDELSKQMSQMQVAIETEIEDESFYNLAVSADENKEADDTLKLGLARNAMYRAAMAKTEEENKQWDLLKAQHRENLDKEINLKRITFKGPVDVTKWNLPNYSDIFEDISYMDSNISYQISLLKSTQDKIKKSALLTNVSVAALKSKITSNFECVFADSPRSLIKRCF